MATMVDIPTVPAESLNDRSSDDETLIELIKKSQTNNEPDETQGTQELILKSKDTARKDSGLDDTSEDEPLTKLLNRLKKNTVKRPESAHRGTGIGSEKAKNKIAVSTKDEDSYNSSDDEPLIKMVKRLPKQTSLPFKKRPFNTSRELNDLSKGRNNIKITNNMCTDSSSDSSDDMPLSKMVDKLKKQTGKKTLATTRETDIIKPSKVPNKRNRRIVSSDDSSDYEPLTTLNRTSPSEDNVRTLKPCVTKESNSNHIRQSKNKIRREEEMTSDDEPLIRLVKKPLNAVKKSIAPAKKRSVTGNTVVSRKMKRPAIVQKAINRCCTKVGQSMSEGSSDDSSDDEHLNRIRVKNPPMKTLMVILTRCDTRVVLEDNCGAMVRNTCERRAEVENSSDELLIKVVANPPSSPNIMQDTKTKSQDF
ncbi:uncharacterized protein LOC105012617 isoform X2 [Esox lucius]|uniref:uncharacterized protein LOC105012617 isoform X2 n=1 Tax=Esox lucius TaxID=8010 RepID=UPI00147712FF|nr:uncharacterized protein LOC105012617 isoform X2 [Esox lucius]